ncbi:hypothetical protein BC830DRAFT_1164882 [Chytriomyces sp. MP71]|nr:hypothetical protein BC830DRAFT_1164882 [Chytriomyces sp. MP71]
MSFFSFGGASDDAPSAHDGVPIVLHPGAHPSGSSGGPGTSVATVGVQTAPTPASTSLDLSWYTGPDPIALVLEAYTLSLVTAPLVVIETLQETQQLIAAPNATIDAADRSELDAYESTGSSAATSAQKNKAANVPRLGADVWLNVRAVSKAKNLGTFGIIKGHFTTFLLQTLTRATQPLVEESLNDAFDVFDDTHPMTNLLSHVLISSVFSPLELIRTRLIAQSGTDLRYYGPFHAAAAIAATEGPHQFGALYAPQHVLSTAICKGISSLLHSLSRSIIKHDLGLSSEYNPLMYTTAVLIFMAAETFVVTPFEHARKRLQIQNLKPARKRKAGEAIVPFSTCVDVNTTKRYDGMFDVIRRVIVEETLPSPNAVVAATNATAEAAAASSSSFDDELDTYINPSLKKNKGDWQDLYASPSSAAKAKEAAAKKKSVLTKYWDGLRSLYRGYWTRYSIRVVEFAFEGLRDAGDHAWDI